MFKAKIEAKNWKKIINSLSGIIEEVKLEITQEGIFFTAMDPSHISMVDFKLGKENFEEFLPGEEKEGENTIGVDIDEMRKIINRTKPGDILTLIADEATLRLEFTQPDVNYVRRFKIPQIDVMQTEKFKVPALDTTAEITFSGNVFNDAIKDVFLISDNVLFGAQKPVFVIGGEGDSGKAVVEIKEWKGYNVTEPCQSAYNLSYLTDIAKSVEDEVTIYLGNDMPVKICFTLCGAEFTYILAPRVDKE